ncbi:hypothetical protein [Dyadobacter sp. LHD-138]|uniref:hypothetical protein n=1 Tax=Dyadobacter sp. LHD-138 TaxID=3071413 RepID=UPI0027E18BA2|nr:hypothetical protein [Dyadobacter sp. LHD-138]MDQ6481444.1 hypothetical protein [Dyadobacter sp. LHD-138]
MYKSPFIIAFLLSAALIFNSANAQSSNQVDPGISTHNYKHPNKAAKAKAQRTDEIVVSNINTIETYSKQQNKRYVSKTPKYAPRATPLVINRTYQKEGVEINPLTSPRNYKTTNISDKNQESSVPDFDNKADSLLSSTQN